MDNQHLEFPTEKQQHPAEMQNDTDTMTRYVFTWRTTGLTAGAKTIDDMIATLDGAADALRVLKEAGVVLDAGTAEGDDAHLITTDPDVAQRFGFTGEDVKQEARDDVPTDNTTDAKAGQ